MKKVISLLFALMLLSVYICGCGQSDEKKMVGKWVNVDDSTDRMEFLSDGTGKIEDSKYSFTLSEWKIVDGKLKVVVSSSFAGDTIVTCDYKFKNGLLTTIDSDGIETVYEKQ